jgi:hypothetical protein
LANNGLEQLSKQPVTNGRLVKHPLNLRRAALRVWGDDFVKDAQIQHEALAARSSIGTIGTPEEIAKAVVFLASDDASAQRRGRIKQHARKGSTFLVELPFKIPKLPNPLSGSAILFTRNLPAIH